MWIGVISNTVGVVPRPIIDVFDGVDYILHCGNIGAPSVIEELSLVAPISGVIGANDSAEDYPFERTLFRRWCDVGVYVSHRIGDPMNLTRAARKKLEEHEPQVVLFGGSGESFNTRVESRLFLNPGTAGRRRPKASRSVGLLEIDGHSVRAEVVPVGDGET